MRRLKRNQREFTLYQYLGTRDTVDSRGHKTGHNDPVYDEPVTYKGCIVFKGSSAFRPYGVEENFSVCIIPDKPILMITTSSRIVIDGVAYTVKSHPRTMNEQRIYCDEANH